MIIRPLIDKESSTLTYVVGDPISKEAVIIDPVDSNLERDFLLINELGLKLKYILETHIHADHITSAINLKNKTNAKIAVGSNSGHKQADQLLNDDDEIRIGQKTIKVIQTPGHTEGCISFYVNDNLFTGDALLIRGCGRTDFQGGSASRLYQSVHEKLFVLPDETRVYPGHDYKGRIFSTIGEEKNFNPRLSLQKDEQEFIQIMDQLKLDPPKKINEAVPANLMGGKPEESI